MPVLEKVAALVPMRHHSQRVPGKNYRPLAGRPLYHHILETLQICPEVDTIVVDTDSPIIMDGLAEFFPEVVVLERPEHLRADDVPMNEVLLHDTAAVPGDLYLQTHSTNPLLKAETISKAIRTLRDAYPTFDSLFSATRWQTRFWDQLSRPLNHNPNILLQTQDLPPVYEENSSIYLFTRRHLVERSNRLGERPYLFEMDRAEAFDIDEELDFLLADLLLTHRLSEKNK
jgi:CMP-N-acetylneuraminic acid synthetase